MRERLYKIAIFLLFIVLLPLLYFALKSEPPPKKKIKSYKEQTVEIFTFTEISETGKEWILKSPKAVFKGKDVLLEKPILKILSNNSTIYAREATYNQEKNLAFLKKIQLESKDFTAQTKEGVFNGKTETFRSTKPCIIEFTNGYTIKGNRCLIDLKSGKVIIDNGVSTIIEKSEVKGEKR